MEQPPPDPPPNPQVNEEADLGTGIDFWESKNYLKLAEMNTMLQKGLMQGSNMQVMPVGIESQIQNFSAAGGQTPGGGDAGGPTGLPGGALPGLPGAGNGAAGSPAGLPTAGDPGVGSPAGAPAGAGPAGPGGGQFSVPPGGPGGPGSSGGGGY